MAMFSRESLENHWHQVFEEVLHFDVRPRGLRAGLDLQLIKQANDRVVRAWVGGSSRDPHAARGDREIELHGTLAHDLGDGRLLMTGIAVQDAYRRGEADRAVIRRTQHHLVKATEMLRETAPSVKAEDVALEFNPTAFPPPGVVILMKAAPALDDMRYHLRREDFVRVDDSEPTLADVLGVSTFGQGLDPELRKTATAQVLGMGATDLGPEHCIVQSQEAKRLSANDETFPSVVVMVMPLNPHFTPELASEETVKAALKEAAKLIENVPVERLSQAGYHFVFTLEEVARKGRGW
jgi:hypothetical protein